MRTTKAPVLAGLLTATALLVPVPSAAAQAGPAPVGTAAESWFRTLPVPAQVPSSCDLPVGCPPAPPVPLPSTYPPGTLHVGVSRGQEESRTYLALDLTALPAGVRVVGGTLTLPVADPSSGTVSPETAQLRVCAAPEAVPDGVDGDPAGAPPADCASSSPASYAAAEDGAPARFTVDLAPLADALAMGGSLVVLPAEAPAPSSSWHVAFSRRDRDAASAVPITAELAVAGSEDGAEVVVDVPSDGGGGGGGESTAGGPFLAGGTVDPGSGASFAAPPLAAAGEPLTAPGAPQLAAPTAQVPVAALLGGPFAYPAVFLLPLLVGAAVGWAGRAFTRDLVPVRA